MPAKRYLPKELLAEHSAFRERVSSSEFFNDPKYQRAREQWCAAHFAVGYEKHLAAARSPRLDAAEQALLLEDLQSPRTEEVAVFQAFSRIVSEGRSAFVVLDTAPTGHSMLLMDATGAYHRQLTREFKEHGSWH